MSTKPAINPVAQSLVSLAITLVVMGVLMFWPAGTLDWSRGWWFIGVFVAAILVSIAILAQVNPEIFAARAKVTAAGTKGWDKVIVTIVLVAFAAILPVAGFDYRLQLAQAPDWLVIGGYILFVIGFAGTGWAQAVNRHFEPSVRIQSDRGHTVIDSGPYAYVRHPGYIFGSLLGFGCALALGSLWALVPSAVLAAGLAIRTLLEEETLVAELPGYAEFRQRTRYRWIPGVW
jgi:protein-S-isoprenylcysteine O-methyltransferase Ste14